MSKGIPPGAQQLGRGAGGGRRSGAGGAVRGRARPRRRGDQGGAPRRRADRWITAACWTKRARGCSRRSAFFAPTLYVGHTILNDNQALNIPAHQVEREKAMQGTQERAFKTALRPVADRVRDRRRGVPARRERARVQAARRAGPAADGRHRGRDPHRGRGDRLGDRVGTLQPGRYADLIASRGPARGHQRARTRPVRDEGRRRLQGRHEGTK